MKEEKTLGAQILFALILIGAMMLPNVGRAQKIYTVYDLAYEAKFEIYDPISPKRLSAIVDSLQGLYDSDSAAYGCGINCSVREITIFKNPPNRQKIKASRWLSAYSDTSHYCSGDFNSFEIKAFEKRGYTMIDTCVFDVTPETYPAPMPLGSYGVTTATLRNEGELIPKLGGFFSIDTDTVGNGGVKKDTVLVQVLCNDHIKWHGASDGLRVGERIDGLSVQKLKQERTLEWQTVPLPDIIQNGIRLDVYRTAQRWVTTETRWLDSVEGCYQLMPLETKN